MHSWALELLDTSTSMITRTDPCIFMPWYSSMVTWFCQELKLILMESSQPLPSRVFNSMQCILSCPQASRAFSEAFEQCLKVDHVMDALLR
jgi:hypothetical protein